MGIEYTNKELNSFKTYLSYVDASLITRDTTVTAHTNELLVHDTSLSLMVKRYVDASAGMTDASGNIGDIVIIQNATDSSMYYKKAMTVNQWLTWTVFDVSFGK